jgi:hypothetical protein
MRLHLIEERPRVGQHPIAKFYRKMLSDFGITVYKDPNSF